MTNGVVGQVWGRRLWRKKNRNQTEEAGQRYASAVLLLFGSGIRFRLRDREEVS